MSRMLLLPSLYAAIVLSKLVQGEVVLVHLLRSLGCQPDSIVLLSKLVHGGVVLIFNPQRACAARVTWSVCLSVSVRSGTTGIKQAYE